MHLRTLLFTAAVLLSAIAHGQITVTQQPGALVTAKQPTPPLTWVAVGPSSQIATSAGGEFKQFLLSGQWTLMAIGADGKLVSTPLTVGGSPSPGPGPGPSPGPTPDPQPVPPNPTPTPGNITAAIVFDPAGMNAETADHAASRMNMDLPRYMEGKGYKWRVLNGSPMDEKGSAAEAWATYQAKQLGKYPAFIIGQPGSSGALLSTQLTDWQAALSNLQKFGGLPTQDEARRGGEFPDVSTPDVDALGVDLPAPAGVSMGLIPARKGKSALKFATPKALGFADIPESQWYEWYTKMPPTIVSQFAWDVKDQDGLGACAAFAASGAVQAAEYAAGLPKKELASFALYSLVAYPRDSGSGLDENANTIQEIGIPERDFSPKFAGTGGWSNSSTWPAGWKENAARHRCSVIDLGGDSSAEGFHDLVVALLHGIPCTIGVDWPGGHSILAVAPVFEANKCTGILIVNSWGADWNGNGRSVRSRSNVTQGISMFGGPYAFVTPTFASKPAAPLPAKPAPVVSCPSGTCPNVRSYKAHPTIDGLRQSFGVPYSIAP